MTLVEGRAEVYGPRAHEQGPLTLSEGALILRAPPGTRTPDPLIKSQLL